MLSRSSNIPLDLVSRRVAFGTYRRRRYSPSAAMDIRDSGIMPPLKGGADLFPSPDYCVSVTVRSRRLRSAVV